MQGLSPMRDPRMSFFSFPSRIQEHQIEIEIKYPRRPHFHFKTIFCQNCLLLKPQLVVFHDAARQTLLVDPQMHNRSIVRTACGLIRKKNWETWESSFLPAEKVTLGFFEVQQCNVTVTAAPGAPGAPWDQLTQAGSGAAENNGRHHIGQEALVNL